MYLKLQYGISKLNCLVFRDVFFLMLQTHLIDTVNHILVAETTAKYERDLLQSVRQFWETIVKEVRLFGW